MTLSLRVESSQHDDDVIVSGDSSHILAEFVSIHLDYSFLSTPVNKLLNPVS